MEFLDCTVCGRDGHRDHITFNLHLVDSFLFLLLLYPLKEWYAPQKTKRQLTGALWRNRVSFLVKEVSQRIYVFGTTESC